MGQYINSITYIFCFLIIFLLPVSIAGQTQLTNLPTFYITTTNKAPIVSKVDWLTGKVTVVSNDLTECMKDLPIQIRGRGNSTWNTMPKKSFRMKFDKKISLLNLPAKEKDWVLLANYADKTLLRNAVAFEIGKQLGMEYTPPVRYGDVYLNGDFVGNYMVTDQLEVTTNRVPVEKQDTLMTTLPDISGGYLIEIDGYLDPVEDPVYLITDKGLNVIIKYPKDDEINFQQKTYISNFVRNFESTLFTSTYTNAESGYRNMVDTTALINWYLACEMTGNSDSFWSTYMYKKRNEDKLIFGPLWDYDIAFNNDKRLGDATQKLMRNDAFDPKTWLKQFTADPWFLKKAYARFLEMKSSGLLQHLQDYIDLNVAEIDASQQQNFKRWDILNTIVYEELAARGTYAAEIKFLKDYLTARFAFLETGLAYKEPITYTSNIDVNYYYNIVNKKNGKSIDIQDASVTDNAKVVLYSLDQLKGSQQWKLIKTGIPDVYYILNKSSGKALQNDGLISTQLFQKTLITGSLYQQWKVVAVDENYAGIQNILPNNYSMNNSSGLINDGNKIIEYTNNITGSDNQKWAFVKANRIITDADELNKEMPSMNIYPNPIEDIAMVSCSGMMNDKIKLSVYSCQGVLIYSVSKQIYGAESINIQLSVKGIGLTSGIYILKLNTERGIEFSSKMVVK